MYPSCWVLSIWLILLSIFPSNFCQILKGFHFNKGRKQIWTLAQDEVKKNSSWFFDFGKYGNCARLDVKPFKLPRQFTVCNKLNHDVADVFMVLSFLSSKSGKSVIEELKTYPWVKFY